MGKPADAATKAERIIAHAAFDKLWQEAWKLPAYNASDGDEKVHRIIEKAARTRAYIWLQDQMCMTRDECHISNFDIEECREATSLCLKIDAAGIRNWYKGSEHARNKEQQQSKDDDRGLQREGA